MTINSSAFLWQWIKRNRENNWFAIHIFLFSKPVVFVHNRLIKVSDFILSNNAKMQCSTRVEFKTLKWIQMYLNRNSRLVISNLEEEILLLRHNLKIFLQKQGCNSETSCRSARKKTFFDFLREKMICLAKKKAIFCE